MAKREGVPINSYKTTVVKEPPSIIKKTIKCCVLNGFVFWLSILVFDSFIIPCIQTFFLSPVFDNMLGDVAAEVNIFFLYFLTRQDLNPSF